MIYVLSGIWLVVMILSWLCFDGSTFSAVMAGCWTFVAGVSLGVALIEHLDNRG